MGLITGKGKAVKDDLGIDENFGRSKELTVAFIEHLDAYHSLDEKKNNNIELAILDDEINAIKNPKQIDFTRGLITFSPSSASKCERELYYKALKEVKDEQPFLPYQRRWMRNGSAVHAAVQKDLLFAEEYVKDAKYKVARMKAPASVEGRPAWEHNLKNVRPFADLGFQVFGMMDGVLSYEVDGSKIGFEFKTKSTTVAAIGDYKLRAPQDGHVEQVTAYSLLFSLQEFLLVYETLAKDGWGKGVEAKPDVKAFYVKVTEEQRQALLDKFTRVAKAVREKVLPNPEPSKCIFCPYKKVCEAQRYSHE